MQDLIFKLLLYIVKKLNTFSKYICDIKLSYTLRGFHLMNPREL